MQCAIAKSLTRFNLPADSILARPPRFFLPDVCIYVQLLLIHGFVGMYLMVIVRFDVVQIVRSLSRTISTIPSIVKVAPLIIVLFDTRWRAVFLPKSETTI
jgi:hypothetical protein